MLVYDTFSKVRHLRVQYEKRYNGCSADPRAAFPAEGALTLRILVPRALCASSAALRLYRDDDMSILVLEAAHTEFSDAHDVFEAEILPEELCLDGEI